MIILSVSSLENCHLVSKVVGAFSTIENAMTFFNREYSIFEEQLFVPSMLETELDKPDLNKPYLVKSFSDAEQLFNHAKE